MSGRQCRSLSLAGFPSRRITSWPSGVNLRPFARPRSLAKRRDAIVRCPAMDALPLNVREIQVAVEIRGRPLQEPESSYETLDRGTRSHERTFLAVRLAPRPPEARPPDWSRFFASSWPHRWHLLTAANSRLIRAVGVTCLTSLSMALGGFSCRSRHSGRSFHVVRRHLESHRSA